MATKNAIPGFDPNRSNNYVLRPDTPATSGGGSNSSDGKPPAAVDPDASDPSRGFDLGPLHFGFTNRGTPGVSYPGAGAVHDFSNRLTNNVTNNTADSIVSAFPGQPDLVTLRAQRAQADARMGTGAKVGADILGQFNPAALLNAVPGVGPIAQGAAQEGVRSWAGGNDAQKIAGDVVMGGVGGAIGGALGVPKSIADTIKTGAEIGVPAAAAYYFGHDLTHAGITGLLAEKFLKPFTGGIAKVGDAAAELAGPKTQQAIQNLIMGGASNVIQNPQTPPLPFFGYPGN